MVAFITCVNYSLTKAGRRLLKCLNNPSNFWQCIHKSLWQSRVCYTATSSSMANWIDQFCFSLNIHHTSNLKSTNVRPHLSILLLSLQKSCPQTPMELLHTGDTRFRTHYAYCVHLCKDTSHTVGCVGCDDDTYIRARTYSLKLWWCSMALSPLTMV